MDFGSLLLILTVVLFPIVWWFLSDRSEGQTKQDHHAPQEPRYGEPGAGSYGGRAPQTRSDADFGAQAYSRYGGATVDQAPKADPWASSRHEPESTASPWSVFAEELQPMETDVPPARSLGVDVAAARSLEEEHPTPTGIPVGSGVLGTGIQAESPSAATAVPQLRRARRQRRRVLQSLRTHNGLRRAIITQTIIGPPKALAEEDNSFPGR